MVEANSFFDATTNSMTAQTMMNDDGQNDDGATMTLRMTARTMAAQMMMARTMMDVDGKDADGTTIMARMMTRREEEVEEEARGAGGSKPLFRCNNQI